MALAEDAVRLALLQATEPLGAQDLCDAAAGTDQGMPLSNRSLDPARPRLLTLGEIVTTRGAGRRHPRLHALQPASVALRRVLSGTGVSVRVDLGVRRSIKKKK